MDTSSETGTGTAEAGDANETTSSESKSSKKWYIVHTYSGQETRAK